MAARILQACDAAVTLIQAAWAPSAPDGIERAYAPPINLTEDVPPVHTGRRVYIFPGPYDAIPLDRSEQWRTFAIRALVVERYTDADAPANDWIDERVAFKQDKIFNLLANQSLKLVGEMTPDPDQAATIDVLYDVDLLDQLKTFWSVSTYHFVEPATLAGAPPS